MSEDMLGTTFTTQCLHCGRFVSLKLEQGKAAGIPGLTDEFVYSGFCECESKWNIKIEATYMTPFQLKKRFWSEPCSDGNYVVCQSLSHSEVKMYKRYEDGWTSDLKWAKRYNRNNANLMVQSLYAGCEIP